MQDEDANFLSRSPFRGNSRLHLSFVNGLIIENFLLIVEVKTVQATLNHPLYRVCYPAAREPVKRKA